MKRITIAVVTWMSFAAGPAAVAVDAVEPEIQNAVDAHNAQVQREGEQLVCRKEAQIGTRLKKTVCRTKAVMDAEADAARRYVNKPRPVPYKD